MNSINKINQEACIDLHGLSVEDARDAVIYRIKDCHAKKCYSLTLITGRGVHKNKDGARGKIFKALPGWLLDPEIAHLVKASHKYPGYYMLALHPDQRFLTEQHSKHRFMQELSKLSARITGTQFGAGANVADLILNEGLAYLFGYCGVVQDERRGIALIKQAAELGNLDAQLLLGSWYTTGEYGIKIDPQKAKILLTKVIESSTINAADAHYSLARAHLLGIGAKYDVAAGIDHLEQAAKMNHVASLYNLGQVYAGFNLQEQVESDKLRDDTKANVYLLRAAMQNMMEAQVLLAQRCLVGIGMKNPRVDTALMWYARAAGLGDVESMYQMGQVYYYGIANCQQDLNIALQYYLRSAKRQYVPAYTKVAALLLLRENPDNGGVQWLTKAREIGDADAIFIDSLLLLRTTNIKEKTESLALLQLAAELGSPLAIKFNFQYLSTASNLRIHLDNLTTIAQAGDIEAQAACAMILMQTGNLEEANKWYAELATKGIENELAIKLKMCGAFISFFERAATDIVNTIKNIREESFVKETSANTRNSPNTGIITPYKDFSFSTDKNSYQLNKKLLRKLANDRNKQAVFVSEQKAALEDNDFDSRIKSNNLSEQAQSLAVEREYFKNQLIFASREQVYKNQASNNTNVAEHDVIRAGTANYNLTKEEKNIKNPQVIKNEPGYCPYFSRSLLLSLSGAAVTLVVSEYIRRNYCLTS